YYADWELVEYREEIGSMHARDAAGNPVQLKFVTMLARKPLA
ncbi:tellurite methyltransferase, partial [Kingella kingae]|nr:tellurite methyltransferase [Kingella kingae]